MFKTAALARSSQLSRCPRGEQRVGERSRARSAYMSGADRSSTRARGGIRERLTTNPNPGAASTAPCLSTFLTGSRLPGHGPTGLGHTWSSSMIAACRFPKGARRSRTFSALPSRVGIAAAARSQSAMRRDGEVSSNPMCRPPPPPPPVGQAHGSEVAGARNARRLETGMLARAAR